MRVRCKVLHREHMRIIKAYANRRSLSQAHCPTCPLPSVGVVLDNAVLDSDDSDGDHDAQVVAGNTVCSVCVKMHF